MDAHDGLHAVLPEELGDLLLRCVVRKIAHVKRAIFARLRSAATTTAAAARAAGPAGPELTTTRWLR